MEDKLFNITAVIDHFEGSLVGLNDVSIIKYVNAFEELSRLFSILGMVFSFVEVDVSEKRGILRDLYELDVENYETVEKMVDFECFENNTKIEPKNRGSRTLLRLHRALAFLIKFVEGLQESESTDKSVVSHFQSAYRETLANHHTWFVRQSVSFASHTIPNRDRLLDAIFNENINDEIDQDSERVDKLATNLVVALNNVYERVQRIYTERDLLSLP